MPPGEVPLAYDVGPDGAVAGACAAAFAFRSLWAWACPRGAGPVVALRVEPLSKAQRLAPDGLPSLTQHSQAGAAGNGDDVSGPFPCPGRAGLFPSRCA